MTRASDRPGLRARAFDRTTTRSRWGAAAAVGFTLTVASSAWLMSTAPAASGGTASAAVAGDADLCAVIPALPARAPTAGDTGVSPGTHLTPSGSITAGTPGAVLKDLSVTGTITVTADNVTIENSKISTTGYYGIKIMNGAEGTRILHNEIFAPNGGYTGIQTGDGDSTICGNDIHHFENGITALGPTIIQANLIEHLQGSPGAHYDDIELYAGAPAKVWGNNLKMTDANGTWLDETAAINLAATWSDISGDDLRGNWLGGGGYTLYITDGGTGGATYTTKNNTVVDNHFYGSGPHGTAAWGPLYPAPRGAISQWSGNTWENGSPVQE